MKGFRAQVVERIEELEEREREKKELLDEVTALAEEYGLDAGPLRAALSS